MRYVDLYASGELRRRAESLRTRMEICDLCPRECGANRLDGERGDCGATDVLRIASHNPHFGEEAPLVGRGGSGTIFMGHCSLRCVFCINWDVSQGAAGARRTICDMADMMLSLARRGCHNVNVVTPTHWSAHVLEALDEAASRGLEVPLVWNTSGWERLPVLTELDGVVDIYLADFKYWDPEVAGTYSPGATSYPEVTRAALLEMHRQVGAAHPDPDGVMQRGLMIRHLVMPGGASGSHEVVGWIARHLPRDTYVNIMSQYGPVYRAREFPAIDRPVTRDEYESVVRAARDAGLVNLDIQGYRW